MSNANAVVAMRDKSDAPAPHVLKAISAVTATIAKEGIAKSRKNDQQERAAEQQKIKQARNGETHDETSRGKQLHATARRRTQRRVRCIRGHGNTGQLLRRRQAVT